MADRIIQAGLQINSALFTLVNDKVLPGTGIQPSHFWESLASIWQKLGEKNHQLLAKRLHLQKQLDNWHSQNPGPIQDQETYQQFLKDINYLVDEGEDFSITTQQVDDEIAKVAGPQLVVPVNNARFALNAANARWGNLYDALYGSDVIGDEEGLAQSKEFNVKRAAAVVDWAADFLDQAIPLQQGSHKEAKTYQLIKQDDQTIQLRITLSNDEQTQLNDEQQLIGYNIDEDNAEKSRLLFRNNGLHIEMGIDPDHPIGQKSPSGISQIILEAALSSIMDCEDSVAAVDAEDKVQVYHNWLGLMKGDLSVTFNKGDTTLKRTLNPDKVFTTPQGSQITLPGRSLLLVRNVGHLMTNDAVLDEQGNEIPEGILDAMVTSACAIHDLKKQGRYTNSRQGSVYIVKPKMHGPEEVALTDELFTAVETALNLEANTLKVGVMDEERRTSANLKACIRAVKNRLVFINTGFLDRTGDEMHTAMQAGAMLPKAQIKEQPWIQAYEDRNVAIGLACGLKGVAQIGKGMWAMPDEMLKMIQSKQDHPLAGANCAWVPSPTAATLHATHYHQVNVGEQQDKLAKREPTPLTPLLTLPLLDKQKLSAEQIQAELDNNAQGILGYVVRWIDQGIGCSKVPDIHNIDLMEDRATLRISSQHLANWLHHGICTTEQVMTTLKRMAEVVDQQNADDPEYQNMAPDFDQSIAFQAACDLVFKGIEQPSGYTEPVLHARRREAKQA